MNILKNKDIVLSLLQKQIHLRDNDFKLLANVWHKHITNLGIDAKNYTAYDLLLMLADGKLPNSESVRRIRQKLQEEFKDLRGTNYTKRHNQKGKVKEQLYNTPEILKGGTP
tara:strand:+ start:355 stop:690 length:336 start_codon:yes stop_codon:yes gene_type:complete